MPIISRLHRMGVKQLWVEHPLTSDLDQAVSREVMKVRLEVYDRLKNDMQRLEHCSVTNAQVQAYRRTIIDLIRELVAYRVFAGLADQLFDAEHELVSHGSNVAYLATLVGLELEAYLVRERPKLPENRARNVVNLGLGAMLHDIGKLQVGDEAAGTHEALTEDELSVQYQRHPRTGYEMLRSADVPPTVRHVVLAHHRRFNGQGFPDMAKTSGDGSRIQPSGRRVHIFARIVAAANVLDNLLRDADGEQRPPVAALCDFASSRFDGWFDPIVRLAVLRRLPPFAVGSQVELSDGRPAVVIAPNLRQPCRPTVRVLSTSDDGVVPTLDLEERRQLSIVTYAGVEVRQWLFELAEPKPGAAPTGRPEADAA